METTQTEITTPDIVHAYIFARIHFAETLLSAIEGAEKDNIFSQREIVEIIKAHTTTEYGNDVIAWAEYADYNSSLRQFYQQEIASSIRKNTPSKIGNTLMVAYTQKETTVIYKRGWWKGFIVGIILLAVLLVLFTFTHI